MNREGEEEEEEEELPPPAILIGWMALDVSGPIRPDAVVSGPAPVERPLVMAVPWDLNRTVQSARIASASEKHIHESNATPINMK